MEKDKDYGFVKRKMWDDEEVDDDGKVITVPETNKYKNKQFYLSNPTIVEQQEKLSSIKGEASRNQGCPHCIWINKMTNLWKNIPLIVATEPERIRDNFYGMTVYNAHPVLPYTFNCVSGIQSGNINVYHSLKSLSSLFRGVFDFVQNLFCESFKNSKKNNTEILSKIVLMCDNHFSKERNAKDHPHVKLIFDEKSDKQFTDTWFSKIKQRSGEKPKDLTSMYGYLFSLTHDECQNFFYSSDVYKIIEMYANFVKTNFDYTKQSFYLRIVFQRGINCSANSIDYRMTGDLAF